MLTDKDLIKSSKNGITYRVLAVGEDFVDAIYKNTNSDGWQRKEIKYTCSPDEAVLVEVKEWGRIQVFKQVAIEQAITAGVMQKIN
jgi:hypothetical protein